MAIKQMLDVAAMQRHFFEDTALIGVVTPLPAYRFAWLLNERLAMHFVRDAENDICIYKKNGNEPVYFSLYRYESAYHGLRYLIYRLKSEQEWLLPEVKNVDYLWMVQSNSPQKDATLLSRTLLTLPEIQFARVFVPGELKNIKNLII